MNRPGSVSQPLRGIQTGFPSQHQQQQQQQQQQQANRAGTNRLPASGKPGSNGNGWPLGSGMPMGSGGLPGSTRQLGVGGNLNFAQSLGVSSQPGAPLDPSEYPSLSNHSQLSSASQPSMWANETPRTNRTILGSSALRGSTTPLSAQPGQQEDLFSSGRLGSFSQAAFRYGGQGNTTAQAPQAQPSSMEEFPPLNRNANGDIGQERNSGLMGGGVGFTSQAAMASMQQGNRSVNGFITALTNTSRAADMRSPIGMQRPQQEARALAGEDDARQKQQRENGLAAQSSSLTATDGPSAQMESRNPLGAIGGAVGSAVGSSAGADAAAGGHGGNGGNGGSGGKDEQQRGKADKYEDPLAGMAPIDKFGLKGLRTLMNNYPDYNALTFGLDPMSLGFDLTSPEPLMTQSYSLFDDVPPRPVAPKFHIPDCYVVKNIAPIVAKVHSFSEETLMCIFYSCPGDEKQQMAAEVLLDRKWCWHKKMRVWFKVDGHMVPHVMTPNGSVRGYFEVWDAMSWQKERRQIDITNTADIVGRVGGSLPQGA